MRLRLRSLLSSQDLNMSMMSVSSYGDRGKRRSEMRGRRGKVVREKAEGVCARSPPCAEGTAPHAQEDGGLWQLMSTTMEE